MNLKEMIENRIEENNVLIKKLEDENDEMEIKMFDDYLIRYVKKLWRDKNKERRK